MDLERKFLEFKKDSLNEKGEFFGYASTYGNEDLGGDIMMKGAFDNSIKTRGGEVPMLWQHKMDTPIGKILVESDDSGLKSLGFINLETVKGKEAYALMKQGAIKGLSIGYKVKDENYQANGWTRELKEVELYEVSIVTFPMNTESNVDIRTLKAEASKKELEEKEALVKAELEKKELEENKNQEMVTLVDTIDSYFESKTLENKINEIDDYFGGKNG